MATRTTKLLPHLWKQPQHVIYVPAFILFGYYLAVMYALFTLHETAWGRRAGIGDPSAATAAATTAVDDEKTGYFACYTGVPASPRSHSMTPEPLTPLTPTSPTHTLCRLG